MFKGENKLLNQLAQFIDWFIPASMIGDKSQRSLARLFLVSHLCGPFIGCTVPLALYVISPKPGWDIAVLAISITGFWIFPLLLKLGIRYNTLAIASIQDLIFAIMWSCYFHGAINSPTLSWVLSIPLLAFFYIGGSRVMRNVVLIQFFANLAILVACLHFLPPPDDGIPHQRLQAIGLVSTAAAALYVAMMAAYYARALASQAEIKLEMERHIKTASELRLAAAETERASAAKSEFLAKMSHELRTPLNAIIGYGQMLVEDAEDSGDSYIEDYRKILMSGQHLLRLVNNVLDLSRIEAGHSELFNEMFSVRSVLTSITHSLRYRAKENNIALELHPDGMPGVMIGDSPKIQCILLNVIENAVRYTKNGRVDVYCRRIEINGRAIIRFEVIDEGPGIRPEELSCLFEQFSVGDDLSNAKYGGTGVGLALCRKLCTLMGGSIEVETEVGKGSCVRVDIPGDLVATNKAEPEAAAEPDPVSFEEQPTVMVAHA